MIVVLPNSLEGPATRDTTRGATITGQHERGLGIKRLRIRSTSPPPIRSGVYQRPPARLRMICIRETPDPAHHAGV